MCGLEADFDDVCWRWALVRIAADCGFWLGLPNGWPEQRVSLCWVVMPKLGWWGEGGGGEEL